MKRASLLELPKTFLLILFVGLFLWNLAIIMAPVLVQSQMEMLRYLGTTVYFFMDPVCHQLPERSLYLMGLPLPVCGRCTTIYFAGLITVGWVLIKNRFTHWPRSVYAGLALIVALEIFMEKLYLIESWMELRLISGLALGILIFRLVLEGAVSERVRKINE